MHKRTANIPLKLRNTKWKRTHNRAIIGALCLKQLQMKRDIPAFNGFTLGICLWSWIEKNICMGSWNDYCKNKRQRQWHVSNIHNWSKQQLKSPTIWGSKFRHRSNNLYFETMEMIEILNSKKDWVLIKLPDWRKGRVRRNDLEKYFENLFDK